MNSFNVLKMTTILLILSFVVFQFFAAPAVDFKTYVKVHSEEVSGSDRISEAAGLTAGNGEVQAHLSAGVDFMRLLPSFLFY